jgi:hypothetical protein
MSVMIVSAYFKIPSKQPHAFYVSHLERFFRSLKAPLVFFTSPDVEVEIRGWGFDLRHVQFVHTSIPELTAFQTYSPSFWDRQTKRDSETYHTPELAAVWFEKKEFVLRAMSMTDAEVFIWCDAGCVRNPATEAALTAFGLRSADLRSAELRDGRLHLQQIRPIQPKAFYKYPDVSIAGAIIAGNRVAWTTHSTLYNESLNEYDACGISGNSDQYVTLRCTDKQPSLYMLHPPPPDCRVDPWFFFLQTL